MSDRQEVLWKITNSNDGARKKLKKNVNKTVKRTHKPESKIKFFFNMVARVEAKVMRLRKKKTPDEKRLAKNAYCRVWSKKPENKKKSTNG